MLNCDICKTEGHYKLKCIDRVWACPLCSGKREFKESGVGLKTKIKIGNQWATKRQLDEMDRRVMLPYSKPGGGYYLGRRGENGKVQERHPDYRP